MERWLNRVALIWRWFSLRTWNDFNIGSGSYRRTDQPCRVSVRIVVVVLLRGVEQAILRCWRGSGRGGEEGLRVMELVLGLLLWSVILESWELVGWREHNARLSTSEWSHGCG